MRITEEVKDLNAVQKGKAGNQEGYTIKDIYALPDAERAELIDGRMFAMAPPGRTHQKYSMQIANAIYDYIQKQQGECEVYAAPFGVFLNADDKTYVEPDISVICDKDKLTEEGCSGAPDWIIEIVSPGRKARDYMTKLFQYRMAAVREYWIVDPEKQMTTVYGFEKEAVEHYNFGAKVPSGILLGLSIRVE